MGNRCGAKYIMIRDNEDGKSIKEMKMRAAIEKVLIIVPASLRIQWQDGLLRFFNEHFIIVDTELALEQEVTKRYQLVEKLALIKGRRKGENIRLTVNERLTNKLEYAAKGIGAISHYEIDGKEIERFGG